MLESLELSGVPTELFVTPPTPDQWANRHGMQAFGIAGMSRAMTVAQMNDELPDVLSSIRTHQPRFAHYKICSTFDSSPRVGSIGHAIEIGQTVFQNRVTPLLVAAPHLGRYCAFGNLFARSGSSGEISRLDRHAAMADHPITPMREADLRRHLAEQTKLPIVLIDVLALDRGAEAALAAIERAKDGSIVLFDSLRDEHLATAGRVMARLQEGENQPLFVVGSSGIELALSSQRTSACHAAAASTDLPTCCSEHGEATTPILVLSGSCSPVTRRQIVTAATKGFLELPLDVRRVQASADPAAELNRMATLVASAYETGRSIVIHTNDEQTQGRMTEQATINVGAFLARLLGNVLQMTPVKRIVVAGGDTSGSIARAIGIDSLKLVRPLETGAPLCAARSADERVDGVEFVFKGGQIGNDDFFSVAAAAKSSLRCTSQPNGRPAAVPNAFASQNPLTSA